ncbi:hypothetical protein FOCC_FOCC006450 [Frankliniella occidentalis]|nr:hypothetical protein FOCC_FOCC006450 [Frankliniella occidentalis]
MKAVAFNRCCNPFEEKNHVKRQDLRVFTNDQAQKLPSFPNGSKLCRSCRGRVNRLTCPQQPDLDDSGFGKGDDDDDGGDEDTETADSDQGQRPNDCTDSGDNPLPTCEDPLHKAGVAVLEQLKECFNIVTTRAEQLQILTLCPKFWGKKKIASFFGCSKRLAKAGKNLQTTHGVFSAPPRRQGRILADTKTVVDFYQKDCYSRLMPGQKDCASMRENGVKVQKRLVLCNLRELYASFKEEHPSVSAGKEAEEDTVVGVAQLH